MLWGRAGFVGLHHALAKGCFTQTIFQGLSSPLHEGFVQIVAELSQLALLAELSLLKDQQPPAISPWSQILLFLAERMLLSLGRQ